MSSIPMAQVSASCIRASKTPLSVRASWLGGLLLSQHRSAAQPGHRRENHLHTLFLSSVGWWWPLVFGLFPAVVFITLGFALLWLAVDARPAIAFGLYFEVIYVVRSFARASQLSDAPTVQEGLIIALLAAALAGAALRIRTRANT